MTETIVADLKNIALAKKLGESWENTLHWLAMQHEEWLLLLNNADDTTLNIRNYFPCCSHGNILITTQNHEIGQHALDRQSCCHLSGMHPNDAKNLLFNITKLREGHTKETNTVATDIVKVYFTTVRHVNSLTVPQELSYLALAVVQAGAYIFNSECSLDQYLELYQEQHMGFLEEYGDIVQKVDDYEWTVYTTWLISFRRLSAQSAMFLRLCAYLHHDGISEAIFWNTASKATTYEPSSIIDRLEPSKPNNML